MRASFASPSATGLYVLVRQRDGHYVAKPFEGYDVLGNPRVAVYTRGQIEDQIAIGADVTFTAIPPSVKVGGIPTWLAVTLGVVGTGLLAAFFRKRR